MSHARASESRLTVPQLPIFGEQDMMEGLKHSTVEMPLTKTKTTLASESTRASHRFVSALLCNASLRRCYGSFKNPRMDHELIVDGTRH
eukprot:scaffold3508_cov113-Cylindrotheca_fusiformis.AAC.8